MLKALVLCQRRSGSTFATKLVKVALGLKHDSKMYERSIIPYEPCQDILEAGRLKLWLRMWRDKIRVIKIEEPSTNQALVDHIINIFPRVKAISTVRSIEAIVSSRMKLKEAWGKSTSPSKILTEYIEQYHFLSSFVQSNPGRLFMINLDQPHEFSPDQFCCFLSVKLTPKFEEYAYEFKPVNTFLNQARKHKLTEESQAENHYSREDLIKICPDLAEYEAKYSELIQEVNGQLT